MMLDNHIGNWGNVSTMIGILVGGDGKFQSSLYKKKKRHFERRKYEKIK